MKCRECKLWDIEAAKDKAGKVRKANAVKCLWVSKEKWPSSVSVYLCRRPTTSYMTAIDGERCPCFQKREKE